MHCHLTFGFDLRSLPKTGDRFSPQLAKTNIHPNAELTADVVTTFSLNNDARFEHFGSSEDRSIRVVSCSVSSPNMAVF